MARDSGFWPVFVQGFPPKPKFHPDQIPDHTGRIVLVTGGNSGIGYETCKEMLKHNAKVYLAARSPEKADAAIASLKVETGKEGIFLKLDLGSMASVKAAAQEFFSKESELHILFNNAGVMVPPVELLTTDEYDLQFGTHVLGHFYLTESLMPALLAAVRTSPDGHARVVTTSSSSVYLERLHFETFKDGPERIKLGKAALYNQSKHGNAVIARQVAKRYGDQGIVSISLNPSTIQTSLQRHFPAVVHMILKAVLLKPVEYGVLTQLFAGTMPEALNYNGEFLIPWARLGRAHPECYNDEIGERLWDWLQGKVRAFEARQS
ncbi:NAD(P)-binding protein [Dichomitus squalens LYAD-421 SS1]|uniref:NAD(P)-binding protein n=1 Tax=Dichomitus squalens (strain LYAD-421) TaxID=732165 RepID=R7SNV3_DICSQ|nr:NAD(P)-binding protein [Dichomitus squalens LYAD-421 SS1]EJF57874.1 NAD(P)-binding protein [Dichomitus squalens LYAD-421 SS1]